MTGTFQSDISQFKHSRESCLISFRHFCLAWGSKKVCVYNALILINTRTRTHAWRGQPAEPSKAAIVICALSSLLAQLTSSQIIAPTLTYNECGLSRFTAARKAMVKL